MSDNQHTIQPTFVRYLSTTRNGVQSQNLSRHAIGYVVNGKRHIHMGDIVREVSKSELFYLGIGTHYTEDIPEGGSFEMIVFYITPEDLSHILNNLSINYGVSLDPTSCSECGDAKNKVFQPSMLLKISFGALAHMLLDEQFNNDRVASAIKGHELVYEMLVSNDCCLRNLILSFASEKRDRLEQIVHKHIFDLISIETLASKCNRSLSTFKKEFVRIFNDTPHHWIMHQRLIHARLMLISTDRDLSHICQECKFHNSSHFIKLFRKEYGMTPSVYRQKYSTQNSMREKTKVNA